MLKEVKNWIQYYAKPGYEDKRALHDFIDCESRETVSSFRAEIIGIKNGKVSNDSLEAILGKNRENRYESYPNWAQLMIIWMVEANK